MMAIRRKIVESKYTEWIEAMKSSIQGALLIPGALRNISVRSLIGVLTVITANDIPRLNVAPTLIIVALAPDAKPLTSRGTEFIIDALFGDAKIPIPDPISTKGINSP
jgi:hypothetical protein